MLQIIKGIAKGDEAGSSLLELLVSLPLLSIMMLCIGTVLIFGLKSYVFLLSNWELQDQVRLPMERLVMDLEYADRVVTEGNTLKIYKYTDGTTDLIVYNVTNGRRPELMRNMQPITGGSKLADVAVTDFQFKVENNRLVTFKLEAKNMLTEKSFLLQSAVYISGAGI